MQEVVKCPKYFRENLCATSIQLSLQIKNYVYKSKSIKDLEKKEDADKESDNVVDMAK